VTYFCLGPNAQEDQNGRAYWLQYMDKVAKSVLSNLAADQLKQKMRIELSPAFDNAENLQSAKVKGTLTVIIESTLDASGTFSEEGWLGIGLSRQQPELGDFYATTGNLYLCASIYLPLGLQADNPFWTEPDTPWTAKKIWSGQNIPADHSLHD
jgi:hypothetical protein